MIVVIEKNKFYGYENEIIAKSVDESLTGEKLYSNFNPKLHRTVLADYISCKWKVDGDRLTACPIKNCWHSTTYTEKQFYEDEIPSDYTENIPIQVLKNKLIAENEKKMYADIDQGFSYDGHNFSMSDKDLILYLSIGLLYTRSLIEKDVIYPPTGAPIKTIDNGFYFLTIDKFNIFFDLLFNKVALMKLAEGMTEKNKILAMTTKEELENYINTKTIK